MRNRKLATALAVTLVAALAAVAATVAVVVAAPDAAQAEAGSTGLWQVYEQSFKNARYIDLTHEITPDIPVWKGFGPGKFSASVDPKTGKPYTYAKDGFEATAYRLATDQFGTQLDPPAHWAPEYPGIDELPATYAVRPLVVISIVAQVAQDPKYALQVSDIRTFEQKNGRIPAGAVVMVRSDWSKKWTDDSARAKALAADPVFPGVSLDALKFLHLQRQILFHGHEPLDTDTTPTLEGESWLMHHGYTQAEGVANLEAVPETGCLVAIGYPKFKGGLGGYARYVAICPPSTAKGARISRHDAPLPKSGKRLHWDILHEPPAGSLEAPHRRAWNGRAADVGNEPRAAGVFLPVRHVRLTNRTKGDRVMSSNDTEGLVLRLCRLLRARGAEGVAGTTRLFMKQSHRTAIAAVIFAAVFASTASAAMAIPPGDGDDPILRCPPGYRMVDDVCVKIPPPPPSNSPVVSLDIARQTTDRGAIRVAGKASDADQPQTALTVKISIDGVQVRTVTANLPDPPVATPYVATIPPTTPPGHSYNTVVPAAPTAQQVCVTAVNVGSGSDKTLCKPVDAVVEFAGRSISYDLDRLQITASSLEELDRVTNTNSTTVQQSTTVKGEKTVTDKHGWENTQGVKVTAEGKVGIPFVSEGKVTVEGSFTWQQNGENTTETKFAWEQPVLVPPKSKVVATVAVTETTLVVPYTLSGDYVYASGARVAGTNGGTFTGVNSHDLEVTLRQFNLDGSPAARPVQQPKASLLTVS